MSGEQEPRPLDMNRGPGHLVRDETGDYRILGNTMDEHTYAGSAAYVTEIILQRRETGEPRVLPIALDQITD